MKKRSVVGFALAATIGAVVLGGGGVAANAAGNDTTPTAPAATGGEPVSVAANWGIHHDGWKVTVVNMSTYPVQLEHTTFGNMHLFPDGYLLPDERVTATGLPSVSGGPANADFQIFAITNASTGYEVLHPFLRSNDDGTYYAECGPAAGYYTYNVKCYAAATSLDKSIFFTITDR